MNNEKGGWRVFGKRRKVKIKITDMPKEQANTGDELTDEELEGVDGGLDRGPKPSILSFFNNALGRLGGGVHGIRGRIE